MNEEKKPTYTPEQREAARRLLELRRLRREELSRSRVLEHRIRERTRKRKPVLTERSEIVAMLGEYKASIERRHELGGEMAQLEELLAPILAARAGPSVVVTVTASGGRRTPR